MIILKWEPKIGIWCEEEDGIDKLRKNHFGEMKLTKRESRHPKGEKRYPSHSLRMDSLSGKAHWYPDSLFSVVDDEKAGQILFNSHWFGQLGVYRQERGSLLRLDFMETIFLSKHFGLKAIEASTDKPVTGEQILAQVSKKREYAGRLYEVYEDWRLKGYVVEP